MNRSTSPMHRNFLCPPFSMPLTSTLVFPHFPCQVHTNYGTPEAWKSLVPSSGVLSFDYVSGVTPPTDAVAVADTQVGGGVDLDLATSSRLTLACIPRYKSSMRHP